MSYVDLDNRIFLLERTIGLPEDLSRLLAEAVVDFLQDRDVEATIKVAAIERACAARGISVVPVNLFGLYSV